MVNRHPANSLKSNKNCSELIKAIESREGKCTSMTNMWAHTEINQCSAFVSCGLGLLHSLIKNAHLEFVIGKHLKEILFRQE